MKFTESVRGITQRRPTKSEAKIDPPYVLKRMTKMRDEFDGIIEELQIVSNPRTVRQIETSLKAERDGRTKKLNLPELKKAMGL